MDEQEQVVDRLQEMWKRQEILQTLLNPNDVRHNASSIPGLHHAVKEMIEASIQRHTFALIMEGAELMNWTRWKHWSQRLGNKHDVDFLGDDHLKEIHLEIIDLFHFLMNLGIVTGMTPDLFYQLYCEKNGINHKRQDTGTY